MENMEGNETEMPNKLNKYDSFLEIMKELSQFHASQFLLDTLVIAGDGELWVHSLMLTAVSPFLKALFNLVSDASEEHYTLHLPDIHKYELDILIDLLYTGTTLIHKSQLDSIKSLTGLLKMISIPVTMTKQDAKTNSSIEQKQMSDKVYLKCDNSISKEIIINKMKSSNELTDLYSGSPTKRVRMSLNNISKIIKSESNIKSVSQPIRTPVLSNNVHLLPTTLHSNTQPNIQTSIGSSFNTIHLAKELTLSSNNSDNVTAKLTRSSTSLLTSTHSHHTTTTNHQDLSKYTTMRISDLAAKDFNPLFEENSNMSDVNEEPKYSGAFSGFDGANGDTNGGNVVDKQGGEEEMSEGRVLFEEEGYIVGDMEDCFDADAHQQLDSVKEIQVFVSGNGEVTAMEVLKDEQGSNHPPHQTQNEQTSRITDIKHALNDSSTQNPMDTSNFANTSKVTDANSAITTTATVDQTAKNSNDSAVVASDLDFDVHQISTINPEAPFVISTVDGGEGVIGLISVTEAFENSQKTDFNDVAASTEAESSETATLIRQCALCLKSSLGRHAYGRHMKTAHPKIFGPYECPWPNCKRTQEDGGKMLTHITQQHSRSVGGGNIAVNSEENNKDNTEENQCKICNIVLSSQDYLIKHNSRFHGIITSSSDVKIGEISSEKNVYVCSASGGPCALEFMTSKSYVSHMKNVHDEKPWMCDECGSRFEIKQTYQQHTMRHGKQKSFICDLCNKSYATPRLLYSHRSLHLGRRFPCNLCTFVGRSSANIRGHKINVHGERRFACKVCCKRFAMSNNLQDHMRIHTGETPFTCEVCDMSYKRKHHLTCHIRSKAHMNMVINCHKLGIKVPPELDPDEPAVSGTKQDVINNRLNSMILPVMDEEAAIISAASASGGNGGSNNFETHIAEIDADQQVLIFEPCEEIEPYIIQETEEVVVM